MHKGIKAPDQVGGELRGQLLRREIHISTKAMRAASATIARQIQPYTMTMGANPFWIRVKGLDHKTSLFSGDVNIDFPISRTCTQGYPPGLANLDPGDSLLPALDSGQGRQLERRGLTLIMRSTLAGKDP